MEDDPRVGPHFDEFWSSPVSSSIHTLLFEQNSDQWPCEIILLSSVLLPYQKCKPTSMPGLYYTFGTVQSGLCYIINRKTCEWMIEQFDNGQLYGHLDLRLAERTRQWLARPLLFHHRANLSNTMKWISLDIVFRQLYYSKWGNIFAERWYYNGWMRRFLIFCLVLLVVTIVALTITMTILYTLNT